MHFPPNETEIQGLSAEGAAVALTAPPVIYTVIAHITDVYAYKLEAFYSDEIF